MDYSEKIKAVQQSVGVEADGIAASKTWIAIYHQLFASVPYDLNIESIIKAVQQKIKVRVNGQASSRTWDALYYHLVPQEQVEEKSCIEEHNEIILQSMTKEVVPFALELIRLAAIENIYIKLMACAAQRGNAFGLSKHTATDQGQLDFGLVFDIGIYEKMESGAYVYRDISPLYTRVAKIGNSIGLTCAADQKTFTSIPQFELRPAWAVRMKEMDMIKELCRRKKENINLLAIL
ncbi:MAG: hypothetical protein REI78_09885 [Pedobacter sp.]|nr:hypothetical protein [Pedobacter sp.]MDQ8053325.1 hypothetical protein [Pedobacter sp.]